MFVKGKVNASLCKSFHVCISNDDEMILSHPLDDQMSSVHDVL